MGRRRRVVLERRWAALLAVVGVADVLVASRTHAFTRGADAATAVPLVLATVLLAVRARAAGAIDTRAADTGVIDTGADDGPTGRRPRMLGIDPAYVWVLPVAAVTAWELYCFFTLPRSAHPTLSSLLDMLDAHAAGKALAFGVWLVLGWLLVVA